MPDIARLGAIEEEACLRRVAVEAVVALEHSERHQRIEEIARRTLMQAEAAAQRFGVGRAFRQDGEQAELDRREQDFRVPKGEAETEDFVR